MGVPSSYDDDQDEIMSVNKKVIFDLIAQVEALGGGDVTPTEWVEATEPIPFSDTAVFPPYVIGGHLVAFKDNKWQCVCHSSPPHPFNPFWGVEGHPDEGVGIDHYDAALHDAYILTFGETTKTERLARIQEVING